MKKILTNKKGVTILEGLIALTLLALVATGTFAVLLSTSRKSSQPDIREEMALAVEKAMQKLQVYVYPVSGTGDSDVTTQIAGGLCGADSSPLALNTTHDISCLLPPICDSSNSSFTYALIAASQPLPRQADQQKVRNSQGAATTTTDVSGRSLYRVTLNINCNGFTL